MKLCLSLILMSRSHILGASLLWDAVTKNADGVAKSNVVAGEVELQLGATKIATIATGPLGGSIDSLVSGLAPGSYTLCARAVDSLGQRSICATLPYVVAPPVPTKLVVTVVHTGKDLNNAEVKIDRAELRIVSLGAGPSAVALAIVPSTLGNLSRFEVANIPGLSGGSSAYVRAHSAAGWSSYTPEIHLRFPPSAPQEASRAVPLTVPARPTNVKVEAK